MPLVGRGVGEAEEVAGLETDVPLEVLPVFPGVPPVTGKRERTAPVGDATAVGAGEEREGDGMGSRGFEGDGDGDGGAETGKRVPAGAGVESADLVFGGLFEEPVSGLKLEGVGAMRGDRDGEAEAIVAEKRGEAGEGVGEAVGMPDAAVEKLVLAGVRRAGREGQFEAGDRRGELEMVEMGDERAEQDLRRCRRLGKTDAMEVRRRGFEIELEFDVGGGAVGGSEPGAKSVQRAFEEENEWLAAVDGVLEIDGGNDGLGRPEKAQETAGFAVKQVMDGGDGRTQAFGEALTGKLGEIGQGAEAPLRENFQVPRAEFQMLEEREGESGEWVLGGGRMFPAGFGATENEDVAGGGVEGEKVGEVGGGGVGQMEGKTEPADAGVPSGK